jgi:hypothetical protein
MHEHRLHGFDFGYNCLGVAVNQRMAARISLWFSILKLHGHLFAESDLELFDQLRQRLWLRSPALSLRYKTYARHCTATAITLADKPTTLHSVLLLLRERFGICCVARTHYIRRLNG